jgi:hypothetical protein
MESSTVDRAAVDAAHAELPNGAGSRAEIEGEEGVAVGDMPAPEPPSALPPEELRVDGTTQLGLFKAGGKSPTGATLTLVGGAIEIVDGRAFEKGDLITFSGTARVGFVGQRDKEDKKTGIVVSCTQQHQARIIDLQIGAE